MGSGQVAWYRLDPGRHALCLRRVPGGRPLSDLDAQWIVRGHAARLWIEEEP